MQSFIEFTVKETNEKVLKLYLVFYFILGSQEINFFMLCTVTLPEFFRVDLVQSYGFSPRWTKTKFLETESCFLITKIVGCGFSVIILCWHQSDGLTINILSQYCWLLVHKTIIRKCCKCVALFTIQIERSYFLKCSQVGSRTVTAKASSLFYSLATELHWQEIGFNLSFHCSIHGLLLFYAWNCNLSCCGFLAWFLFISFKCIHLSYVAFQKKKIWINVVIKSVAYSGLLFCSQIVYSVDIPVKPSLTPVTCTCVQVIITLHFMHIQVDLQQIKHLAVSWYYPREGREVGLRLSSEITLVPVVHF